METRKHERAKKKHAAALMDNSRLLTDRQSEPSGVEVHLRYAERLVSTYGGDAAPQSNGAKQWDDYRGMLEQVRRRQDDKKLNLSVIGEFTTGKSTFINALLRKELLASSSLQGTTVASTVIEYGREYRIQAEYLDHRTPKDICFNSFEELRKSLQALTTDPSVARQLRAVHVFLPAELLKSSFRIIDTPGTNVTEAWHEEVTIRTLNEISDLSVILISAEKPAAETTLAFLKEHLESALPQCVFVVTKLDNLRPRERQRQLDYIKQRLEDRLDLERAIVLPYVSPMVLAMEQPEAQRTCRIDSELLQWSMATQQALLQHMAEQRTVAQTQKLAHLIESIEQSAHIDEFDPEMKRLMEQTKHYCPQCGRKLLKYQVICPGCGKMHRMKVGEMNQETKNRLLEISRTMSRDSADYSICWDLEARRIAETISKVDSLSAKVNLSGVTDALKTDMEHLIYRCANPEFQIAIVGIMKAGKSMLMNALMGAEIASVNINPETAALTKFRSGSGYSVSVRFHTPEGWKKLCASAEEAKKVLKSGGQSDGEETEESTKPLHEMLALPQVKAMSKEWVGHSPLQIPCAGVEAVQAEVARWTSSHAYEHLFVSEVEVRIDHSLFDMPEEVVFVDTPGLKDPVQYRSNITKEYIRKANAVLIALETKAMDAQMLETTTMALDYVGTKLEKAYIIGTQKDKLNSSSDEKTVIRGWVKNLTATGRFRNREDAAEHIITTSAYMRLLCQRFLSLTEEQLEDDALFTDEEYNNLERFVKNGLSKNKRYHLDSIREDDEDAAAVMELSGIPRLQELLRTGLLSKYRDYLIQGIREEYLRCRSEMLSIAEQVQISQGRILSSARKGSNELRKRFEESSKSYEEAKAKNAEIQETARLLRVITAKWIKNL